MRVLRQGKIRRDRPAHRPRLEDKGIREEEVVKEGFVGPLARLLSGQGIWWVGWRAELASCGGEAQVIEDLPDDGRALDHGDHLHRAPAMRTEERIDLVDVTNQARPRAADLQGCSSGFIGDRFCPFGLPEQAVPPAVTACPPVCVHRTGRIGVPAIEERGLLVGIRDGQ